MNLFKRMRRAIKFASKKRKFYRYHMGDYTQFGSRVSIDHKETRIGKFCSIANDVKIGTTQHPTGWLSTHLFQYGHPNIFQPLPEYQPLTFACSSLPCVIGNDVWIGTNAIIMDGIHIGDGAIVAAGAIVTKDVPPYAIVGGVPARLIRYRFDDKTIERLLKVRWWDRDINEIVKLPFDDIEACLEKLEGKSAKSRKRRK